MFHSSHHIVDRRATLRASLRLVLAAGCVGCHPLITPPHVTPLDHLLKPAGGGLDQIALEIIHVRIPDSQTGQADALWRQVDELSLSADLRRNLIANGFRAGVVGSVLPDKLADWLGSQGEEQELTSKRLITEQSASPQVRRRVVQLDPEQQTVVHASDVTQELRLLISHDGRLSGRTYPDAEGVYEVRAEPVTGQRVALHVTPEVHHGEFRNRYAKGDTGMIMMVQSRERETFDSLRLDVELLPGDCLVLGCLSDAGSSLGQAFHTGKMGGPAERKLILFRVLQVPQSEILADR